MGCYAVAAMLEEPPSVPSRHHGESSAHRLYERLAGTHPGPPEEGVELGKRFFYGVEIGRVGRQVEKRAASLLDELAHPRTFVRREVVHHHYLPRFQFGSKAPLHISLEDGLRVAPSTARDGPIPERLMLAKSVTFAPQLRGAEQSAR